MTKRIIDKLRETATAVAIEGHRVGDRLQAQAIEAILNGPTSTPWKEYMQNFADTPDQLNRLQLADSLSGDKSVRRSVAYIVSNAICGTETGTQTHKFVDEDLDKDLVSP